MNSRQWFGEFGREENVKGDVVKIRKEWHLRCRQNTKKLSTRSECENGSEKKDETRQMWRKQNFKMRDHLALRLTQRSYYCYKSQQLGITLLSCDLQLSGAEGRPWTSSVFQERHERVCMGKWSVKGGIMCTFRTVVAALCWRCQGLSAC